MKTENVGRLAEWAFNRPPSFAAEANRRSPVPGDRASRKCLRPHADAFDSGYDPSYPGPNRCKDQDLPLTEYSQTKKMSAIGGGLELVVLPAYHSVHKFGAPCEAETDCGVDSGIERESALPRFESALAVRNDAGGAAGGGPGGGTESARLIAFGQLAFGP